MRCPLRARFFPRKSNSVESLMLETFFDEEALKKRKNPLKYRLTLYSLTSECIFSILFSIHLLSADKENLFINQEFFKLVIIFYILVTLLHDSGGIV